VRVRIVVWAVFAGLAGALALGSPASAKGALSATVTGPGLATPVRLVQGDGPDGQRLDALGEATRVLWVASGNRVEATAPPAGLGDAYQVVYDVGCHLVVEGGECVRVWLRLLAYPFAAPAPVVVVPAGQTRPYDDTAALPAGWLYAEPELPGLMETLGARQQNTVAATTAAPQAASAQRLFHWPVPAMVAAAVGIVLFVAWRVSRAVVSRADRRGGGRAVG
jgi:hypothetical protein